MSTQEIQSNKLKLIHWITELQDANLLEMLLAFQTENNDLPKWQKDELDKRLAAIENGSMKTRSWETAKKEIFKK